MNPALLPAYYANLESSNIEESLRDFDSPQNIDFFNSAISSVKSRNFVLDFGDFDAYCAIDLEASDYHKLLKAPVSN